MDKHKAILVEENGKQLKYKLHDNIRPITAEKESAAAVDESEESIPVLTGLHKSKKGLQKKRQGKFNYFKPILFALGSAVIIGSLLGISMLRLFVDVEAEMTAPTVNNNAATAVQDNEAATAVSLFNPEPLHAFVLQAGIFSEKGNAEEWAGEYAEKGVPAMIWERDQQYFLIAGAADTKEGAKAIADGLQKGGNVEIYVKEWSTAAGEVNVTATEQDWLAKFKNLWEASLVSWSEQNSISMEGWEGLLAESPEQSDGLSPLTTAITEAGEQVTQIHLLQWMYYYEQLSH
ncbi:SPOR domain-containing protein [Oceanobacillus massiliensis]|uniref:SPOR domain-containing protein n=1 Tax=Oceanobacillus massiliensis TaxID=1465765 RepID=UPI0002890949|nr:SPOR domain-containing protein [Oceanobacillus massiliensis]